MTLKRQGKYVISPQFDGAGSFKCNYAKIKVRDKWGFITHKGTYLVVPLFDDVKDFSIAN